MPDTLSLKDELFPVDAPPEGYPAGAAALDAVHRVLTRFIAFPSHEAADAVSLWAAHTWVYQAFAATPRLAFTSDGPGCGKSLAMELTGLLVRDPLSCGGLTGPALMFGISKREPGAIMVDEADVVFGASGRAHADVRGVLNLGYKRGAKYLRAAGQDVKEWPVYCPAAFAGIGRLPDTLHDRSVVVKLSKPGKQPERYRARLHEYLVQATGVSLGEWAKSAVTELAADIPEPIAGVELRSEEIWQPLLSIGNIAGAGWPERARAACEALVLGTSDTLSVPPDIALLADIQAVFKGSRMPSNMLVDALMALPGSRWADEWKPAVATAQMAGMLAGHGIAPRPMRLAGGRTARSYDRSQFSAAWAASSGKLSLANSP